MLASDALLQPLVVHVKVSHRFFLGARWDSLKLLLEGLVVDLQFVLHLLLLSHQVLVAE